MVYFTHVLCTANKCKCNVYVYFIGECGWSVISSSVATMYYIDADFGNCWWFEERTCKTWVIFIRCGSGLWTIWVHNRRISINCIKISYDAIDLFLFFFFICLILRVFRYAVKYLNDRRWRRLVSILSSSR